MKRRMCTLALALILCLGLTAPALGAEPAQRGQMVYEEIIAPQYDKAFSFSEDLAAVEKDGKWGYIDTDNNLVIPFQYDVAFNFHEGFGVVGLPGMREASARYFAGYDEETGEEIYETDTWTESVYRMGFVDRTGKFTPFMAVDRSVEDGTLSQVEVRAYSLEKDEWDYIFHNGYVILPWSNGNNNEEGNYLLDSTGSEVEVGHGRVACTYPVNEGVIVAMRPDENWSGWGTRRYVDLTTGELLELADPFPGQFGTRYFDIRPFNQGLAPVYVVEYRPYDPDVDYSDYDWEECGGNTEYDEPLGWGIVDKTGSWVVKPDPSRKEIWIQNIASAYTIFGETGVALLGNMYTSTPNWGGVDKGGNVVIPFRYDCLRAPFEGLMTYKEDDKWGYLKADTQEVAIPAQFDEATNFNGGFAVVAARVNGQRTACAIDREGNPVPGAENLDAGIYFKLNGRIASPDEYVVIQRDKKYGFGRITYAPNLPAQADMSDWAYKEVTGAIESDLVPASLQALYHQNITRSEFCALAVAAVEANTGKDIDAVVLEKTGKTLDQFVHAYPFTDATGRNILACYALGIVNGRGNGLFDPYASITRQEAANMLYHLAQVLGVAAGEAVSFADAAAFPSWAVEAINAVSGMVDPTTGNAVMGGTGEGNFSPLMTYTREQAYVTSLRLFNAAR